MKRTDNSAKQKAYYQFTQFIAAGKHIEFGLRAADIAIITIMVRYLDMPQGFCSLSQENFAIECCMSKCEFEKRTKFLVERKIVFRYFRKRCYQYELGEEMTGIPNE